MQFTSTIIAAALAASAAAFAIPALPDPKTWDLYFYSEEACMGIQDGSATGPSKKHKGVVCKAIPDVSYTQAVEFYAGSSAFSLQFATDSKCKDLTGQDYYGVDSYPTCALIPGNAKYYKVTTS